MLIKQFLCITVIATLGSCRFSEVPVAGESSKSIQFANITPDEIKYVGDDACSTCHSEQYAGFQNHGMARSFSTVTSEHRNEEFNGTAIYHEESDFYYRPIESDSGYYQEEYRLDDSGTKVHSILRRMDYVVGSGGAALTYLTADNGRLFELPLTWYTQRGDWDFSPGYDVSNVRFERLILDRCMACHNAYPVDIENLEGKYISIPEGIGCERCHGPGALHVDERLKDPDLMVDVDTTIVNPVHLDLNRRLDVCQQCHLNGSIDVLREGRSAFDFQPSELLSDHRAMFVSSDLETDGIRVISHADRMKQSECFIATFKTSSPLECTTCHDPHEGFRERGYEYFTSTCQSCHDPEKLTIGRSIEFVESHKAETNCIACHMPRQEAQDVPHASFTDHYIRVVSNDDSTAPAGVPETLTSRDVSMSPLFQKDDGSREGDIYRGMALITFGRQKADLGSIAKGVTLIESNLTEDDEFVSARFLVGLGYLFLGEVDSAIGPLEKVVTSDPNDPEKLNALAQAYESDGRERRTIERLYERSLDIQPMAADIRLNYGRYLLSLGELDSAIEEFKLVAVERPTYGAAYYNLGTAYLQSGDRHTASTFLHRSLHLDPDNQEALGNLGFLHASSGDVDSARVYFERAVDVGVVNHVALGNLGAFYLNEGDQEGAIEVLERAVEIKPDFVDALANLSLAYFQVEDFDQSLQFANRALSIAPGHELATQIINAL